MWVVAPGEKKNYAYPNSGTNGYIVNGQALLFYYWYSALGPVWAETRAQSGDWYGSGTLHPGQVLRGSLPLLSTLIKLVY